MMDKKQVNDVMRHNVALLSKLSEQEVGMMPATEAPLPSVDQVKQIVTLAKRIIFPDYFNKRQPDEAIRAYYIGVHMEELTTLLTKQIAHGLQFCEDCEANRFIRRLNGWRLSLSVSCRRLKGCFIRMFRQCLTTTQLHLTMVR